MGLALWGILQGQGAHWLCLCSWGFPASRQRLQGNMIQFLVLWLPGALLTTQLSHSKARFEERRGPDGGNDVRLPGREFLWTCGSRRGAAFSACLAMMFWARVWLTSAIMSGFRYLRKRLRAAEKVDARHSRTSRGSEEVVVEGRSSYIRRTRTRRSKIGRSYCDWAAGGRWMHHHGGDRDSTGGNS